MTRPRLLCADPAMTAALAGILLSVEGMELLPHGDHRDPKQRRKPAPRMVASPADEIATWNAAIEAKRAAKKARRTASKGADTARHEPNVQEESAAHLPVRLLTGKEQ